jgi:hypothetical protein
MVREKKQRHFLESESGFRRLLKAERDRVPTDETLKQIRDYTIRSGKLDRVELAASLPGTAAYFVRFLQKAERKSDQQIAEELDVEAAELNSLMKAMSPVKDKTLLEYCSGFANAHPAFTVRPLFTLLKRALVLHSMSTTGSLRKAARKKKKSS